ncbi:MAG: hypothetical protein JW878_05485 [Methanomicrobia archaeon]|nr:hypothetical protein [Methanomicrobia archaeon]
MKRWLLVVVALLLLSIAVAAAQPADDTDLTQEQAAVLEKYQAELESGLIIMEGNPFSQHLPNPLIVIGSHLDAVEKKYYPTILAEYPGVPQIQDTDTAYNGKSIYDYNLILIGGPTHNRISTELYEQGVYDFERKTSRPKIVILGIQNATSAGAAVLCGTIYGFKFVPDKTVPMMEVIPPEAVPVAAATTGIALAGLGTKLLAFLRKFTQTAVEEIGEEVLLEKASYKQIPRGLNKIALLGLSRIEFMHIIASFVLFGAFMAWAVSPASLFLENLPAYLIGAGLVLIVHEFMHNFTSHRFGVESEFRTSAVGMIAVAITSVLFGTVFAVPGKTILYGEPTQDQRGKIALSGPVLSFIMVLLFWLLADYGGFLGSIGLAGFNVAFIMAVYEMLPITPMDGKEVKSWKRWVWALFFFPVFALYAWMFLFV